MLDAIMFFLVSLFSSTIGAISGIGGGIIIKPVLDAVYDLGVAQISFLSASTVLAMCVISLLRSRGGEIVLEKRRGTALAVGAAVGGIAGKQIFDLALRGVSNPGVVGAFQSVILALLTAGVFVYIRLKHRVTPKQVQNLAACALLVLCLGLVSSFLGIGGGPFNIAVISFCLGMDSKTSALHSIYVVFFSTVASLVTTLLTGLVTVVPLYLVVMIAGGFLGGQAGSRIVRKITHKQVDTVFSCVLVLVVAICCYNIVRYL